MCTSNRNYQYSLDDSLILSSGYNSTHLPVLSDIYLDPAFIKRVKIEGMHTIDQLTLRVQLLHTDHCDAAESGNTSEEHLRQYLN